ncbi:MAG: nucleoside hydrolase [Rhodospirillales bacterium]|nr:nucleoside hydrolase [Rhodospirillales bacterium]MCB9995149.1 nucleoside hydrolase [Rhodospirillales bacterium]
MTTVNPLVIDCDTGRDDALAIWISLQKKLPLTTVVSSYGNTTLENVVENNRRVLRLFYTGDVPADAPRLYTGMESPQSYHSAYQEITLPRQRESGNGLANVELPPAGESLKSIPLKNLEMRIMEAPQPLDYVITGPASNLASMLTNHGAPLAKQINTVTMMGGKFDPLWQDMPGADFNLACDPFAIQTIFDHGIKIRFVPMNATWPIAINLEDIEALSPQTEIGEVSKNLMIAHCRNFAPEPVFRFHDPAVIMACLSPESFVETTLSINADEFSPDFGQLEETDSGSPASIFKPDEALQHQFLEDMLATLGLGKET